MPGHGNAGVKANRAIGSASAPQDGIGRQLQVIKVYPLDGKTVAKSRFWIAVTQVQHEMGKRLFLRDGQRHREISTESAMRLLSTKDGKDLSSILKENSTTAITCNSIECLHDASLLNSVNQISSSYTVDIDKKLSATSLSLISIEALVQSAQSKNWGAIKVSGSELFRRQVWLEAASRGMYVEGYVHSESDRQALLDHTPKSAQSYIRPEYRLIQRVDKSYLKPVADFNPKLKKKKIADENNINKSDTSDLSEEELIYLLMRVHQLDVNEKLSDGYDFESRLSKGFNELGTCFDLQLLKIFNLNIEELSDGMEV